MMSAPGKCSRQIYNAILTGQPLLNRIDVERGY